LFDEQLVSLGGFRWLLVLDWLRAPSVGPRVVVRHFGGKLSVFSGMGMGMVSVLGYRDTRRAYAGYILSKL
jgi:hypothetical protein